MLKFWIGRCGITPTKFENNNSSIQMNFIEFSSVIFVSVVLILSLNFQFKANDLIIGRCKINRWNSLVPFLNF